MASKWADAKKERMKQVNGLCEICGQPGEVGHHIIPREKGGEDTVENCQIRCIAGEQLCHKLFKDGNPPKKWLTKRKAFFENAP